MVHGPAFLIPALRRQWALSLAGAALVAAASTIGVMATLIAWGYVVDRIGERTVLVTGLAGTTLAGTAATRVHSGLGLGLVLLLAGAFAASTNAASGRIVVGWFPPHRRGFAMGIRQMAQPLGVGVAALTMSVVGLRHGIGAAMWVPTAATALAGLAVVLVVLDPPRHGTAAGVGARNPYVGQSFLWRVHLVSVLLVVPQFVIWTFALVWLADVRGWSAGAAGALIAVSQVAGALGRIGVGWCSDVVRSRMRPLRWVALAAAATMVALGLAAATMSGTAVVLLVVATAITVADNGLAFTSVAERAGPFWSGRALGVQNTAQFLTASVVAPVAGAAIGSFGFPAVFAVAGLFALAATPLVPVRGEVAAG